MESARRFGPCDSTRILILSQLIALRRSRLNGAGQFGAHVYTTYDMTPLARDLGDAGEPFRWDEDRRAQLRAELDAFFFRLYGIDDQDDVDYILETFQTETGGLKHNDISKYGAYRTKDLVLAEYYRMAAADAVGVQYKSSLAVPPGQGPRHPAERSDGLVRRNGVSATTSAAQPILGRCSETSQ